MPEFIANSPCCWFMYSYIHLPRYWPELSASKTEERVSLINWIKVVSGTREKSDLWACSKCTRLWKEQKHCLKMLKGTIKAEIVHSEKMRRIKSLQREEMISITALHFGREQNLSVLIGKLRSHFMQYTVGELGIQQYTSFKSTRCKLSH